MFQSNNKKLYLHNIYGLGDSVFNLIFFNIINDFIIKNNIIIFYYVKDEYINQLQEFIINKNNINLLSFEEKPNNSIELWIDNDYFKFTFTDLLNYVRTHLNKTHLNFTKFYKGYFNAVLKKSGFNITINKFVYYDEDLLNRYHLLPNKYKDFDILVLNSVPNSGQYKYIKEEWDNYIIGLNNRFKILTTTKVNDDILCTYDDKLTIKDISSLSTKAKVVIAINSGVVPGLLNYYTLTNIKHFYIFDNNCCYSYPNFENRDNINDITFEELENYINQ